MIYTLISLYRYILDFSAKLTFSIKISTTYSYLVNMHIYINKSSKTKTINSKICTSYVHILHSQERENDMVLIKAEMVYYFNDNSVNYNTN